MSDFYDTSSATPSTSQITYGEEITLPSSSSNTLYSQPANGPVPVSQSPPSGHTVGHAENHNHAPSNGAQTMTRSTSNDSNMSLSSSNGVEEGEVRETHVRGGTMVSSHNATRYSTQQPSYIPSWQAQFPFQQPNMQIFNDAWYPSSSYPHENTWHQPDNLNDIEEQLPEDKSSKHTAWQSTDLPYSRSYAVKKKTARNMTWVPPPIPTEDYPPPPPMPPPPNLVTPDYSHLPFVPQSWRQNGHVPESSSSGDRDSTTQALPTRQTKPLPKHKSLTNLSAQAVPFSSSSSAPSLDAPAPLPSKPSTGGGDSKAALRALLLSRKVELERLNLQMAQNSNASGLSALDELEQEASSRNLPPPPASLPPRPSFSPEQPLEPELHTSKSTPDMLHHASLPTSASAPMSLRLSPSPSQVKPPRRRAVATDFESDPTEALRPQTVPLASTSRHADMLIMLSDSDTESSSDDERQCELVPLRQAAAESKEQDLRCHRPFQPQFAMHSYSAIHLQSYSRAASEQEDEGHSWQTGSKRTSLAVRRPATSRTSSFTNQSVLSASHLTHPVVAGPSSLPATALRPSPAGSGTPEPPQTAIQPTSSNGSSVSAGSEVLLLAKQDEIRKMMEKIKALESRKRQKTSSATEMPSLRSTPEASTPVPSSLPPAIADASAIVELDTEKSPPPLARPVEDHATNMQRQHLLQPAEKKAGTLDDGGVSDAMSISDDEEGDTSVLIIGKAI